MVSNKCSVAYCQTSTIFQLSLNDKCLFPFNPHYSMCMKIFIPTIIFLFSALNLSVAHALESFTDSYMGRLLTDVELTSECNLKRNLYGQEPSAPGEYPVFIWLVGTLENSATNAAGKIAVEEMANRGFVSAVVDYDAVTWGGCSLIDKSFLGKTRCIFNSNPNKTGLFLTPTDSALTKLCKRAKANCSKGVTVAGFSQGSVIAILGKNFDSRIKAVYGVGASVEYLGASDLRACMSNGKHALPNKQLRVMNGKDDTYVNLSRLLPPSNPLSDPVGVKKLQELTGLCTDKSASDTPGTAISCLQADGSGWYLIEKNQISGGSPARASHCYMYKEGSVECVGDNRTVLNTEPPSWSTTDEPWGLKANLDWLKSNVSAP